MAGNGTSIDYEEWKNSLPMDAQTRLATATAKAIMNFFELCGLSDMVRKTNVNSMNHDTERWGPKHSMPRYPSKKASRSGWFKVL